MKWVIIIIVALGVTGAVIAGGYLYMERTIKLEAKNVESTNRQLKEQKIDETKKRLDEISTNTKLILEVLSREILFSNLLRQLGATLPAGTALDTIQIDKIEGGLTLKANARDVNAATQIQINLSDPNNKIFQKADIESINCGATTANSQYPCTVQLRALFAKDNPYTYISKSQTSGNNKEKQ